MTHDPSSDRSSYFIDTQGGTELARLIMQDKTVTESMGGPFSDLTDVSALHSVLDLACGPGGWVLDMAAAYPEKEITGIDIDASMIKYARMRARSQKRDSMVHFEIMDITQPLDFLDASFDLINARLMIGFMRPANWPPLLQECWRLTRPGGLLRLTESESSISNGVAFNTWNALLAKAFYAAGQTFSPDGRHFGLVSNLARLVRHAGYQDIRQRASIIDFSFGMPAHEAIRQNTMAMFQLVQPFLVRMGVATFPDLQSLYNDAMAEMLSDNFNGVWFFLSVLGQKPL